MTDFGVLFLVVLVFSIILSVLTLRSKSGGLESHKSTISVSSITMEPRETLNALAQKSPLLLCANGTETDSLEVKKHSWGFRGFYYLILQPIANAVRALFFNPSPEAFLSFLRYVRYIIHPDCCCSHCLREVRRYWRPTVGYLVDSIGMEKNLKPFDEALIGCESCSPVLQSFKQEKQKETFYIV